jgi:tripartite-type tricarboxylate transporter receptor subunit TctC
LNKAVVAAVHSEEGRKRLAEQGLVPIGNSPAVATRLVQDETVRWGAVVKAAGIKAE